MTSPAMKSLPPDKTPPQSPTFCEVLPPTLVSFFLRGPLIHNNFFRWVPSLLQELVKIIGYIGEGVLGGDCHIWSGSKGKFGDIIDI